MSKRRTRREEKLRADRVRAERAAQAMREAGHIGSVAEQANPEDTSEMRGLLSKLLETEETLANIAKRYIAQ